MWMGFLLLFELLGESLDPIYKNPLQLIGAFLRCLVGFITPERFNAERRFS